MSKHTPGPWRYDISYSGDIFISAQTENEPETNIGVLSPDRTLNHKRTHKFDKGTAEANARMIAAAPDLLSALQKMADEIRRNYMDAEYTVYPEVFAATRQSRRKVEKRSARLTSSKTQGGHHRRTQSNHFDKSHENHSIGVQGICVSHIGPSKAKRA